MENLKNIKVGQKIKFKYYDKVYTRKVKSIYIQEFNNVKKYNVNTIGSGTAWTCIDHNDVIEAK